MDNIKLDFQKHIDAGRCNGAEWIINHKNNIYHKDLKLENILIDKNNIIKLIIDKNVAADDMDILLKKYLELKAISITADYDVNFNKFGLDNESDHDLSGVDIPVAIEEFVNLLEDLPNKQEIIDYTVELYSRSK